MLGKDFQTEEAYFPTLLRSDYQENQNCLSVGLEDGSLSDILDAEEDEPQMTVRVKSTKPLIVKKRLET